VLRRLTLPAGLLATAAAIVLPAPSASAATLFTLSVDLPKAGGGNYLQNKMSGYYLGRLFVGESFWSQRTTTDWRLDKRTGRRFNNLYHYGYAGGESRFCATIGPPADQRDYRDYFTNPRPRAQRCPSFSSRGVGSDRWLRDRDHIGKAFNCPDGKATGPAQTTIRARTGLFYNLRWSNDYRGGKSRDRAIDRATGMPLILQPGTLVQYRFMTRDSSKAVVYVPTYGWGFVSASKVDVKQGVYGGASDSPMSGSDVPCKP